MEKVLAYLHSLPSFRSASTYLSTGHLLLALLYLGSFSSQLGYVATIKGKTQEVLTVPIVLLVTTLRVPTCLMFESENLAKGNGNWFTYYSISHESIQIRNGDVLEYSVYLDQANPTPKGGVDIDFSDGNSLRDQGLTDQNGIIAHGDGILSPAIGKWYKRDIPLDKVQGETTASWNLVFEGDEPGRYVQFISEIEILHATGGPTVVYNGGEPQRREIANNSGYSLYPVCEPVPLSAVTNGADLKPLISSVLQRAKRLQALDEIQRDVLVAKPFVETDPKANALLAEVLHEVQSAKNDPNLSEAEVAETAAKARKELAGIEPEVKQYVAHLVGYAHIDFQWLWNWQEAIVAAHDTFNQAVKFADEFPGFKFSESSPDLYRGIEENYPELFGKIKAKVASGQFELLGGRICEADTNVIGPESHVRQFLYGQRYFRETFGKTATVGWEPDTFGHTIQMPQIEKLGGCDWYFFCRAGKGLPLFWWQGLDGTKMLSFDDTANNSWYDSDLTDGQFSTMKNFHDKTGSKDMMYVYGVGNHGGGPTREQIDTAERWIKTPYMPKVEFSTADSFFRSLAKYDLSKLPILTDDLNTVFDGCYTSHMEIKQAMRKAETWTSTAEAASAIASLQGEKYPREALRKNWEDICTNQHHDTMGGSGVHQPYDRTKMMLRRVYDSDQEIINQALITMSQHVTPEKGGISVLVFNPSGWVRSGWCETYLVESGYNSDDPLDPRRAVVLEAGGQEGRVEVLDTVSRRARFWAADVPAFGYKVFHIVNGNRVRQNTAITSHDSNQIEGGHLGMAINLQGGFIGSLTDKGTGHAIEGALGRLEFQNEAPNGMSAWDIGKITRREPLKPTSSEMRTGNGFKEAIFHYMITDPRDSAQNTPVTQIFRLDQDSDEVDCTIEADWNELGNGRKGIPDLKVAFETDLNSPTATYEVPFGAITKPLDDKEYPGQKWSDFSSNGYGLSILNDSMYGNSASAAVASQATPLGGSAGPTLRLTLIRSSYNPDPKPNPGHFVWHYAIYPHAGTWREAGTVKRAAEFNQPLVDVTVPFDATGKMPLQWGLSQFSNPYLVATALKRAEDGDGLVLRYYDISGQSSSSEIRLNATFNGASIVNFLEDPTGPARLSESRVPIHTHGWEIQTLKLKP